ncbi:hypothetical protein BJV77DRAFT_965982 [Russula vinacea]|nr:hypothetical protein BJV77DRAFT_965982 [Russula vinacea]
MSRYEFVPNEFVNSLACVSLETLSTKPGHKDFISVGTTINRGEDLAIKGTTMMCQVPAMRASEQLEAAWDREVGVPPGVRMDSKTGCSSHTGLATRKQRDRAHARAPLRSAVRPGTREGVWRKG